MALPAILWAHVHITEREGAHIWPDGQHDDPSWEDCTWCSAVEWARLTIRTSIPATHVEAEHLRDDAGERPLGGSNENDVVRGIAKRYSKVVPMVWGFTNLWAGLKPGYAAIVAGSMGGFPAGHPLRRFDPPFHGPHRLLVVRVDSSDRVWWCDPLAPVGSYAGQWVSKADLARFVNAFKGGQFIAKVLPKPVVEVIEVQAPVTDESPKLMDVPVGATLFELDGVTKIKRLLNKYPGRYSPYAAGMRAMYATIGGKKRTVLVSPVTGIKAIPDLTPYGTKDLANTAGAATEAEQNRIKTLLGFR